MQNIKQVSSKKDPFQSPDEPTKARQENYTFRERSKLSKLIVKIDKHKILFSASKDAQLRERKDKVWNDVVDSFNLLTSSRKNKSDKQNLIKLARNIRCTERRKLDTKVTNAWNTDCVKTGSGYGSKKPNGKLYLNFEV